MKELIGLFLGIGWGINCVGWCRVIESLRYFMLGKLSRSLPSFLRHLSG